MAENMEAPAKKNPAVWKLSSADPKRAEFLKEALRSAKDPELGYSVIELGLIRDVEIDEKSARIEMILTTPFCPYAPELMAEVRKAAMKALNMPVKIDLKMNVWDPDMMEEGFELDWGLY